MNRWRLPGADAAVWATTALLVGAMIVGAYAQAQAQRTPQSQKDKSTTQGQQQSEKSAEQTPSQPAWQVSTMSVTGQGGEEALRLERKDPPQIRAGEPYDYQLVVTNTSDSPVHDVVVREKKPSDLQIDQSDPQMSPDSSKNESVWRLGMLQPGEEKALRISATPPAEGQMQTCLTLDYKPSLCRLATVVKPELRLERQVVDQEGRPRDLFLACEDLFVQYRLTNVGSGITQESRIEEDLGTLVRTAEGKGTIALNAGRLEAGESYEQRIPLRVAEQTGAYASRATATTDKLTVKSSQSSVDIVKPQLKLAMHGPEKEFVDRPLTYNITVENVGDGPALETMVRMETPGNAERMTFSGQDVRQNGNEFVIGRLDPGASRDLSVTFNISEPRQITTKAVATAYCADEPRQQAMTQVAGVPAVRLEVIDLKDPVRVGEETIYEVRVKNQGSAEDLNLTLQAQLPPELQYVDGRGDTEVKVQDASIQFGKIDRLEPGEIASWHVKARAIKAGRVRFELQMTTGSSQRPIAETEPTTLY